MAHLSSEKIKLKKNTLQKLGEGGAEEPEICPKHFPQAIFAGVFDN